jgi:hypothetical protein
MSKIDKIVKNANGNVELYSKGTLIRCFESTSSVFISSFSRCPVLIRISRQNGSDSLDINYKCIKELTTPAGALPIPTSPEGLLSSLCENFFFLAEDECCSLEETLLVGNITGGTNIAISDNDIIKAVNGDSFIDLRYFGVDGVLLLANQSTFSDGAFFLALPTEIRTGFKTAILKAEETQIKLDLPAANVFQIKPNNFILSNFTLFDLAGEIVGAYNSSNNILFQSTTSVAISLNSGFGLFEKSEVKANVKNSLLLGGKGLTAKTDFTAYLNQISFQESGILFDMIVKSGTITADRIQTLQDKTGTIALLSDISTSPYVEKWTTYNAISNNNWQLLTITDSIANTEIDITICNGTNNDTYGIRVAGSILDRRCPILSDNSVTVRTKVNGLKQIEIYTNDFANTDFIFSAQF